MALDSRDFFATIISLLLRRIRVFNALCVHYAEACFLASTIAGTDLSNHFLMLGRVRFLFLPPFRSKSQKKWFYGQYGHWLPVEATKA
jgi:hypothetical protein